MKTRIPAAIAVAIAAILAGVGASPATAAPIGSYPAAAARPGTCTTADQNAVTVVIDYQELGGGIATYCASNLPGGATGADALAAVGVSTAGTAHDGASFVCRINGRPSATEVIPINGDPNYTEQCANTPPATAYWSYWWAAAGSSQWVYSNYGFRSHRVEFGGYEGWSFSLNRTSGSNPVPRVTPVTPEAAVAEGGTSGGEAQAGSGAGTGSGGGSGAGSTTGAAGSATASATVGETPGEVIESDGATAVSTASTPSGSASAIGADASDASGGVPRGALIGIAAIVVSAGVAAFIVYFKKKQLQ